MGNQGRICDMSLVEFLHSQKWGFHEELSPNMFVHTGLTVAVWMNLHDKFHLLGALVDMRPLCPSENPGTRWITIRIVGAHVSGLSTR